jgi:cytochrome oxidase Cu insertion factor (SCO1/SenC/PrrC family)
MKLGRKTMRTIFFAMLVAAGFALTGASGANAAAAANGAMLGQSVKQSDHVITVRDGCGRHRHWSKWRGRCVWN